jgi:hypothetical protein
VTDDLAGFWVHAVTVERFTGDSAYGSGYASAAVVTGFVDDGARLIVGPNGEQVTSSARVFFPIGTAAIPLQSRVTLPVEFAERSSHVIAVARRDGGGLPLPEHLEVSLQ